jgi:hypothetical protein
LTPTQEARYALDHELPRNSLGSVAAKVEYDRLVYDRLVAGGYGAPRHEQRPPPEKGRKGWTPAEEARYALGFGVSRSDLSPAAQIEYDRLLPAEQARREEAARRRQERERRAAATIWLPNLGVAVYDGNVYQHGTNKSGPASDRLAWGERRERMQTRLLGPLAGSRAEVVSGRAGHRRSGGERAADAVLVAHAIGPVGLLAGAFSRMGYGGLAVVTFPGGGVWQKAFTDSASLIKAQAEVVRFNALVASVGEPAEGSANGAPPAGIGTGVAAELERLAALHKSGALDDEEFRAAKARIIHGGSLP